MRPGAGIGEFFFPLRGPPPPFLQGVAAPMYQEEKDDDDDPQLVLNRIRNNSISTCSWSFAGGQLQQSFWQAIGTNTSVTKLDMSGLKGLYEVAMLEAMSRNKTVKSLILRSVRLQSFATIAAMLEPPDSSLIEVDLFRSSPHIQSAVGFGHLMLCLEGNTTLLKLNISSNYLGNEEARQVADMLCCNTSLMDLKMNTGNIGDVGMQALLKKIAAGPKSLTSIDLSYNKEDDQETVSKIYAVVSKNRERYLNSRIAALVVVAARGVSPFLRGQLPKDVLILIARMLNESWKF